MQLKPPKPIRQALTLATCGMLTSVAPAASVLAVDTPLEVDSAILFYSETDRVQAIEPVVRVRKEIGADEFVSARVVIDALTGSSASGAIATAQPQTFTSPSGKSTYAINASETPLDPTFHDTRGAVNAQSEKPLWETLKGVFTANASSEFDYTSLGLSATLSRDINDKLTTLILGASANLDQVSPIGNIPVGLTPMPVFPVTKATTDSNDTKTVTGLMFGVTQVINRSTLMQLNYSFGSDSGYLTDPYKILSVVNGTTGALHASNPYVYENRPDSRARNALYWKMQHQFTGDVLTLSYRYYGDDWGITSHTLEGFYRYELNDTHYLQPHVRYYRQGKADFYHTYLTDGQESTLKEASADYRLGDLTTTTLGFKYGRVLGEGSEFGVRLEVMNQSGEGDSPIGVMAGQDLSTDFDAIILQINYSLLF